MSRQPNHNNNNSRMVAGINGTSQARYRVAQLPRRFAAAANRPAPHSACQVKRCAQPASATAHVRQTDGRRDGQWRLTRQCATHNHHTRNGHAVPLRRNARLPTVADVRKAAPARRR